MRTLSLILQLSSVLLVIFVADAAITVWQRGDRRQALSVGGSIVFFVVAGTGQVILTLWGIIHAPYTVSSFYMGIVAAMGYELSQNVIHAARLSDDLRESQRRMNLAAQAADLGIWVRDLVRDEIWATDKWRELFGFEKSERLDMHCFLQRLHPEDREAVSKTVARALAGEGSYEMEYRVVLAEGRIRWIASRGGVEFDATGKPVLMRGATSTQLVDQFAQQLTTPTSDLRTLIDQNIVDQLTALDGRNPKLNPASQSCRYGNTLPPSLFCRRFRPISHATLPMR